MLKITINLYLITLKKLYLKKKMYNLQKMLKSNDLRKK